MNQKQDPVRDTELQPTPPQRPLDNKSSHGFVQLSPGELQGQRFHTFLG